MRLFKKLCLICICVITLSTCVYASKSLNNSNKEKVNVCFDVDIDGLCVKFKIHNFSDLDIRNVYILSNKDNDMQSMYSMYKVKDIPANSSVEYKTLLLPFKSNFLYSVNGFSIIFNITITTVLFILSVMLVIMFKNSYFKKPMYCFTYVCFIMSLIGILYTISVATSKYDKPKDYDVYNIEDVVNTEENKILRFNLMYSQDEVTYKVKEEDKPIKFKTNYEFDQDIPCVDEPVIKKEGTEGIEHITKTIKYVNGKKVSTDIRKDITVQPINEVKIQGTKTTIETKSIDAKKKYVPDEELFVGDERLITNIEEAKENAGKKEVTYEWDLKENKVKKTEKIIKQPETNIIGSGCLVKKEVIIPCKTKYVSREDMNVGWENTIDESKDGKLTTIYKVSIDKKTGKQVKGSEFKYVSENYEAPLNGKKEVGTLLIEDNITKCDVVYEDDGSKWDNEESVKQEGKDKIEKVTKIMKLNRKNGNVTDEVVREVSRELVQQEENKIIQKGTKIPNWVEEKKITNHVKFNTIYKPDENLSGDEQRVAVVGENGKLITTQLIAVDENGDRLNSYKPKILEEDALQKPINEVVMVAPDSKLLRKGRE